MASPPQPSNIRSSIRLRGQRKRSVASKLKELHTIRPAASIAASVPVRVICISDTHNTRPTIPPGDVLIHAGDLTENGSFDEVQSELRWLSSQPHQYKILIAGNHDVLLDDAFLERYPERRYGQEKTKEDLEWGSVVYLQDSTVTLEFPCAALGTDRERNTSGSTHKITVYGSPWTPQYGISAFQYKPGDSSHWTTQYDKLTTVKPDVIVTHSPPKHHLDTRDFYQAGCPYLAAELISRLRPRLVVFGHIHASYGKEDVVLDSVQRIYEEVMTGWAGWGSIGWMAILVLWGKLTSRLIGLVAGQREEKATTFVNASVVGGTGNQIMNEPVVVDL